MPKTKAKHERAPEGKVLCQLAIDEELRRRFRARCIEAGTTMSEKVEELIRAWLK
jgi:hypothetical protein